MEEDIDWSQAGTIKEMNHVGSIKRELRYDTEVSKILGIPVLINDQRLINLVVKWKKQTASSADNVDRMDNFLYNPGFLADLRKTFAR